MSKFIKSSIVIVALLAFANVGKAEDHKHGDHNMMMHHMHVLLNEAAGLAAKGSNLVMIGQMGMAGEIDQLTIDKGHALINEAQAMVNEVMKGHSMEEMHKDGINGTNELMAYTHKLGDSVQTYINLVKGMETASAHQH